MRKVKKRKIWAILGAFVVVIACVFSCILPSTVKKETASADSGIDSSQYESANLIIPSYRLTNDSGITFEGLFNDGSFMVSGSSSVTTYKYLCYFYKSTLPSGTYTLSFNEVDGVSFFLETRTSSGSWYSSLIYGKGTFTVDYNGYYEIMFGISVAPNKPYNDVKLYPMLNKGSTAYPFMPNLNYFYDQGYDAAKTEFWRGVDFSVKAKINGSYIRDYITPNYVDYGVDLSCFYDFYTSTYAGATISDITVSLDFPNVLCDNLEIMTTRDLSTWKWSMTDDYHIHNVSAVCDSTDLSFEGQALYFMYPAIYDSDYDVSGDLCLSIISGSISSIDDFKGLVFIENSGFYEGYKQGYTDGGNDAGLYDKGYDTGYGNGYSVGYSEGAGSTNSEKYDAGYNKGYSVGFTEGKLSVDPDSLSNSIRTFIFSLFDAPFAVIEPFIELDVLGIDLGGIFSLILLVGLVSFVFKVI